MDIGISSFSNVGPRPSNQDRLLAPDVFNDTYCISAVADGIGGAAGGDTAAEIAIHFAGKLSGAPDELEPAFSRSVSKMQEFAAADHDLARMGTTLSIALVRPGFVYTAHVGDTRIYHLRGAGLKTLTEDQTEVAELLRKGVLSENQARRYPRRNVLLSALTPESNYQVQYGSSSLEIGDRLLLVTDGVHQRLQKGGILNASLANKKIEEFVREIEKRVSLKEPSDNFSAVGLQVYSW